METKPGEGYLCGFEEDNMSKRWKIQLYDESLKLWEIKIENEDWDSTVWSVTMWTDDGRGNRVVGVLTTETLINVIRYLSNSSDLKEDYIFPVFRILKDGRLIIHKLQESGDDTRITFTSQRIRFTSQQRSNLGEALKEIPMFQALGILEKSKE